MKYLFFTIAFYWLVACQTPQPSSDSKPVSISNKGVNIVYDDTKTGDTALVFVHGWCINRGYWKDQIDFFKNRYRVVSVDLPGFGESGKNRTNWSVAEYGRDIDSVLSALDLRKVILVGHSMSGDIVLEAAINAPDRVLGIIGIDNFKGVGFVADSAYKKNFAAAMDSLRVHYTSLVTDYFNKELFYKTTDSAVRKRILSDVMHCDSVIAIDVIANAEFDENSRIRNYGKTIYLVNSDYTPTDTAGFRKLDAHYDLVQIHATGHYPMVEKPAEFNALLAESIRHLTKP